MAGGGWCPRGGWCSRWLSSVAGGGSLVLVVLLGGWWWLPGIFGRILQPGTQAGARTRSPVRRRSHLNGTLSGFFLIGYYSIYQLFKFSNRILHAKVFTGENIIKTLFSINYRGYFIIQATHSTINYSYFYIKQTENTWETNKIV